jgi:TonB dependent receptor-like, beta-barrel/CarboxypepD_reg-like domain/TonB-dependent Receptor Plug Domain
MRRMLISIGFIFGMISIIHAQAIQGNITDISSNQPIEGVTVYSLPDNRFVTSDLAGNFSFNSARPVNSLQFTSIGYQSRTVSLKEFQNHRNSISLSHVSIELSEVTVSPRAGEQFQAVSKIDIALRDISNSQEVLRLVPGLFIGQHQGGGKAEQIFLRGFDCDHGTDISINADNMSVNMVSHAHGQGYADSHFIIPETIGTVNFKKGPYYTEKGDFCTSGYVDFHTLNFLPYNTVKMEGGMFNTFRLLGMFNMLDEKSKQKQQSWYTAAEYQYTDSYFDNPQHFSRFNFFTKYDGRISKNTWLDLSASAMYSKWNASGQIPGRAVSEGIIGFYGALDPNEGGITSRTNANAQFTTALHNGDMIKNQLYYSYYTFDLHSNFTFYLVDTVNGDEIHQKEARNMFGYKGSYEHVEYIGSARLSSEAGIQFRGDATYNSELSHTKDRYILLNNIKLGNITEFSTSAYLNETLRLSDRFSMNAGLRFDQFYYGYHNKLAADTSYPGTGLYKVSDHSLNPKLSFYYNQNENLQFYLSLGKGFHSNDARSVVAVKSDLSLPAAYGADLGTVFKPARNMIINAALWYITLDQENVYGGDGGTVAFSGKTKRVGFDFSARYQPLQYLFLDLDLNYAHGRSVDEPKGQNYIPLAPVWTSTGGITYSKQNGFNGSLRYRFMGDRPDNENYSLKAIGYFVTDFVLNYTKKNYEIGLTINNVLNTKWKETQFDTVTRLKGEAAPVDEVCFTAGNPFAARLSFSLFFK